MGRWTQYDEDEYRLPEGMKRIGYDADTGQYSYRSRSGAIWEGSEGAEYGELTRLSRSGIPTLITPAPLSRSESDIKESDMKASPISISSHSESGSDGSQLDPPHTMTDKTQTNTKFHRTLNRIYHTQRHWVRCIFFRGDNKPNAVMSSDSSLGGEKNIRH